MSSLTTPRPVHTVTGGGREQRLFTANLALTDVETNRGFTKLAGRAAPYGVAGVRWFFKEVFNAGLFDKSIKSSAATLPLLIFHDDLTWPIGHADEWTSTEDGLDGVWNLDDSAEAQRAARMAADGHLMYLSVGYQPLLSKWEYSDAEAWDPNDVETLDTVTRVEARLLETSVVSTPLFNDAAIKLVASAEHTSRPPRHGAPEHSALARELAWRSTIED